MSIYSHEPPDEPPDDGKSAGAPRFFTAAEREAQREAEMEALRIALRDRVEDVATALLGPPNEALSDRDEIRYGANGATSVVRHGPKAGQWIDWSAELGEDGGDLFDLIQAARRCSFTEAKAWATAFVGGTVQATQPRPQAPPKPPQQNRTGAYAARIAAESVPVAGTPAELYLKLHRGISGPVPEQFRFHPKVWHRYSSQHLPALLIIATENGVVARVQAVFLDPQFGMKANVPQPKLTFGQGKAHVPCTLPAREPGNTVLQMEGPEDAASAWAATGHRVQIALGAGNLGKPAPEPGVDLILCGDNDEAGRRGVEKAARRYHAAGVNVRLCSAPAPHKDLNALNQAEGRSAVAKAIAAAQPWQPPPEPAEPPQAVPTAPTEQAPALANRKDSGAYARSLMASSVPIAEQASERYLQRHHGITGRLPAELRHHPEVWHEAAGTYFEALLIPAFDGDAVTRLEVRFLHPDTNGPAPVTKPVLTLGAGADVPVNFTGTASGATLLVADTIDAIALSAATGMHVLSTMGVQNLAAPEIAAGTDLIIAQPAGDTARRAVARAARRYKDAGTTARVLRLPDGASTFADWLRQAGAEALQRAVGRARKWQAHGLPAFYDAPGEPRDAALARQQALIEGLIQATAIRSGTRREIRRRADEEIAERELPPKEKAAITRRHRRDVLAERGLKTMPPPRRVLLTGSQGSGKTATAIRAVAAIREPISVWVTEPGHAKAEELAADYAEAAGPDSLPHMVIRGRSAADPRRPMEFMCPRHVVVNRLSALGVKVRKKICLTCALQDCCGTMRQEAAIDAMSGVGVFISASIYLFVPSPAPEPDLVIADEQVTLLAIAEVLGLHPDLLRDPGVYHGGTQDLSNVMRTNTTLNRLEEALRTPEPLAALAASGITRADLTFAENELEDALAAARDLDVDGRMTDQAITARVEEILTTTEPRVLSLPKVLAVVRAVLREIDLPRRTLTGVTFDPARKVTVDGKEEIQPRLQVHRLQRLRGVNRKTSVLALDGTGSAELNRVIFGDAMEHHRIAIARNALITGTIGRSYSRQSLLGLNRAGQPLDNRAEDAAKLRRDMVTILDNAQALVPGPIAVFCNKPVAAWLTKDFALDAGWFGRLRGLNLWEACITALVAGRESLSIQALEALARPFMASDPAPFVSADIPAPEGWAFGPWPYVATRGRRMADGSVLPIEVEVHPDPRAQVVLEQVRESDALQAGDRVRPIFGPMKHIIAANSLVLDLTYDRVLSHAELVAGGTRFERAFLATGILPTGAVDLHTVHPAIFPTISTAKHAIEALARESGSAPESQIRTLFGKWGHFQLARFVYRRSAQTGSTSQVLIDLKRHPEPRRALERVLGCTSEMFQTAALPGEATQKTFSLPAAIAAATGGAWGTLSTSPEGITLTELETLARRHGIPIPPGGFPDLAPGHNAWTSTPILLRSHEAEAETLAKAVLSTGIDLAGVGAAKTAAMGALMAAPIYRPADRRDCPPIDRVWG